MTTRPLVAVTAAGQVPVTLAAAPLGRGGEGSVWPAAVSGAFADHGPVVAKLYHPAAADVTARRAAKIAAMVAAAPASDAICWPLAPLWHPPAAGQPARFAGFCMRALPATGFRPWAELAHVADRRAGAPEFSVRYALAAARNLAVALHAVHTAGHAVGDVNESNIFIGADATVRIVDADSAQVSHAGDVFRCEVGKPDYLAPELGSGPLREKTRTAASDTFAYAVLVYQLLTGGAHPADGVPRNLDVDPPSVTERLARHWTPGLTPAADCPLTLPPRVPAAALPAALRVQLAGALDPDPRRRPQLSQLIATLDEIAAQLTDCPAVPLHAYDRRDRACGWCAHAATQPDPWSAHPATEQPAQTALPAVIFHAPGAPPAARPRVPLPTAAAQPPTAAGWTPAQLAALHAATSTGPATPASPPAAQPAGRRTMLVGADGVAQPRPGLLTLAARQPILALRCAWRELPGLCKPAWPARAHAAGRDRRAVPAAAGAVLTVAGGGWAALRYGVPLLFGDTAFAVPAARSAALVAAALALLAAAWLSLSVLRAHHRTAVRQLRARDARHFAVVAATFGPGLVLAVAALVALAVLAAALAVLRAAFDGVVRRL